MACGALDEFGVVHAVNGAVGIDFSFQHGVEARGVEDLAAFGDAAVAATGRAPAVGGVEGEKARVEVFERGVAGGAGGVGGEEDKFFVGGEEFDEAFADFESAGDLSAE